MNEKETELLLKDLCSRLPYGVKVQMVKGVIEELLNVNVRILICNGRKGIPKPYLFPLSSMTEEQKKLYQYITERWMNDPSYSISDSIDWLNKKHFDYRGLIEKGLAIDATGKGIY